jgi:hypothetical protein
MDERTMVFLELNRAAYSSPAATTALHSLPGGHHCTALTALHSLHCTRCTALSAVQCTTMRCTAPHCAADYSSPVATTALHSLHCTPDLSLGLADWVPTDF